MTRLQGMSKPQNFFEGLTANYPAQLEPPEEEHEHRGTVDNIKDEQQVCLCRLPRDVPARPG